MKHIHSQSCNSFKQNLLPNAVKYAMHTTKCKINLSSPPWNIRLLQGLDHHRALRACDLSTKLPREVTFSHNFI